MSAASSCLCAPAYSVGPDGLPLAAPTAAESNSSQPSYLSPKPKPQDNYRVQKSARPRLGPATQDGKGSAKPNGARRLSVGPVRDQSLEEQPAQVGNLGLTSSDSPSPASDFSFQATLPEPLQLINQHDHVLSMKSKELDVTASTMETPIGDCFTFSSPAQDSRLDQNNLDWPLDTKRSQEAGRAEQPKSCCGNKSRSTPQQSLVQNELSVMETQLSDGNTLTEPFLTNDYDVPDLPFEYRISSTQQQTSQDWGSQTQQTIMYNPPPGYATAREPLRPSQLGLPQYDLNSFSTHVLMHPPYGPIESVIPSAGSNAPFNPAHFCNCGDSCSCLACPVHPYNATTRSHVQDLGQIIVNDYNRTLALRQSRESIMQRPMSTSTSNDMSDPVCSLRENLPSPETQELYDSLSPTTQHFDYSQLFDGNNTTVTLNSFESNDYYTMEFPLSQDDVQGRCTELSGACQCLPNECTCIGCLTHHPSENVINGRPESMLVHQDWDSGDPQPPSAPLTFDMPAVGPRQTSCCGKALL